MTHLPREIGDNLLQPVLITNDHAVAIDHTLMEIFPVLIHGSQERPSSDLWAIQVKRQPDLLAAFD